MEELTSIIVVTRNLLDYTRDCLRSINQYTPEPYELILVDNASDDGTAAWLRSVPGAQVITQSSPASYGACVNRALEDAIGDYIVLLDPGCYVTDGWLGRLIAGLRAEPRAGAIGPLTNVALTNPIQNADTPYQDIQAVNAFGQEMARTHAGEYEVVGTLALFCFLMSQEAMEKVGGLDADLTIFSAQDYSLRMRLSRFTLKLARDVFIHRSYVTPWSDEEVHEDDLRFRRKWEKVRGNLEERAAKLE